jgi:3-hydroxyisobutyrate dehydrogenase
MARKPRLGFIGLGAMGRPMARRLATAGFSLRVHDSDAKAVARFRARAKFAGPVDILVTMLPDGTAVRSALAHTDMLARGTLVVDMSSCDPRETRRLGASLARKGVRLLDAPVSGRVDGARAGTLSIMAGGDKRDLRRAMPVLEVLGSKIFHAGPLGAGHAAKALNNYIAAAGTLAAFEATIAGRALGLDPRVLVGIWNASAARNSTTENKIRQHVLSGRYASGFTLALMAKDVAIAAKLARGAPIASAANRVWRAAARAAAQGADHTRIYEYLEARAWRKR